MSDISAERDKFELWASRIGYLMGKGRTGHYESDATDGAWEGWLARAEDEGWRPIESAPKDASIILLGFIPVGNMRRWDRRVYEGRWHEGQQSFTSVNGSILLNSASHWQPVPAPPKEDGE